MPLSVVLSSALGLPVKAGGGRSGPISDHSPSVNSSNFTNSHQIMIICYDGGI